jgi:DNA-binding transcriptional LysR family regulator
VSAAASAPDARDPWLGIELRHLAALAAIKREGTFGDAALSLGYVQSAVSGQLAMLERLTGTELVERTRGPGPQRLTEAGELLVTHSHCIFDELEIARLRLYAADEHAALALRLSLGTGVDDRLAGTLLTAVMAPEHGLQVAQARTLSADALVSALLADEIDVAVSDLPVAHAELATAEVTRRPPELFVHAASPPARAPTLAEFVRIPLVAWREGQDPSRIELELEALGCTPRVVARADSSGAVIDLARAGVGAAVLPRGAATTDARLKALALPDVLEPRIAGLVWRRSRSSEPAIRRAVDLACGLRDRL